MCTNLSHQFDTSFCLVLRLGFFITFLIIICFHSFFQISLYLLWALFMGSSMTINVSATSFISMGEGILWDSLPLSNPCSRSFLKWLLVSWWYLASQPLNILAFLYLSVFSVFYGFWNIECEVKGDFIGNGKNLPRSGFQQIRDR